MPMGRKSGDMTMGRRSGGMVGVRLTFFSLLSHRSLISAFSFFSFSLGHSLF
jgi:hypothetical protein